MLITKARAWERTAGRLLFLAGAAVWLKLSADRLPYGYHDVHYLASLEWGLWGPSEWVHPLFVPVLAFYRAALGLAGWSGRLLLPVELLNVCAAVLTMALLFRACEKWWGGSLPAAAASLLLGFSSGFWEASLRCDPYALAGLCTAAALVSVSSTRDDPAGAPGCGSMCLGGALAGLAAGFHLSAVSLAAVALVPGWRRPRGLACFLGGMVLTLGLSYGVLIVHHGVGLEYFHRMGPAEFFYKIEQVRGTSLYTSGSLARQARDLANSMSVAAGSTLLPVALLMLGLMALGKAVPRLAAAPVSAGPVAVAGAALAAFTLFFFLNNSQNGFVYGGLLGVPVLLAAWSRGWRAAVFVPAALAAVALGSRAEFSAVPSRDPMLVEHRFLNRLLRPGDVIVVPGCPFPELLYERRFNFVAVETAPGELGTACLVPPTDVEALVERAAWTLGRGKRVFFSEGDLGADLEAAMGDVSGAQKLRQPFWTATPALRGSGATAPGRAERVRGIRHRLESAFGLGCSLVSTQGWRYCSLSPKGPKPRLRKRTAAGPGREDVRLLGEALLSQGVSLSARLRTRFLLGWLAETPDDPYAARALVALAADEVDLRSAPSGRDGERIAQIIDALSVKRPSDADKLVQRAQFYAESGMRGKAVAALKKARAMGLSVMGRRRAAWCYQALDDCGAALSFWRELAAGKPAAKDLSDKGVCEFKTGDVRAAVDDIEAALAKDPALLEAYVSLAAIYAKTGNLRGSLEVYERGLAVRGGQGEDALRQQLLDGRELVRQRLAAASPR